MFDVSLLGAALAGLLSFLSPCILPIVPFYLSYMAGVSMNQIADGGAVSGAVRARAVATASLFSLGVIVVFIGFGATATAFGQLFREWFDVLRWIAAAIILVMGLHFLGVVRIGLLYRQFRADAGETSNMSLAGAFVIGAAFAFGWTPCVGPVLAAILFTAAGEETVGQGVRLLTVYGLGMTLPFVLAALFVGPFMRWMKGFRRHLPKVEKAMGVLLVVFALLIGTNTINWIANWMLEAAPGLWLLI
ncbi:cytochrome c biogenesis CcdA family protein [Roseitranquillus sediminis]|uniref:cytochrome c biogenesis CcdA family protein n=1 Tax=Roseitranquillus sediminis TaxID=2809051 RepID=UPI001D0CB3D7|nr:cytochrome c biogenesis protein CcdA [Roseitranquillus sediminis]MBM9594877.1 sulfite exporter TauE/SafE family protein [Roseitranquillus sediminis]